MEEEQEEECEREWIFGASGVFINGTCNCPDGFSGDEYYIIFNDCHVNDKGTLSLQLICFALSMLSNALSLLALKMYWSKIAQWVKHFALFQWIGLTLLNLHSIFAFTFGISFLSPNLSGTLLLLGSATSVYCFFILCAFWESAVRLCLRDDVDLSLIKCLVVAKKVMFLFYASLLLVTLIDGHKEVFLEIVAPATNFGLIVLFSPLFLFSIHFDRVLKKGIEMQLRAMALTGDSNAMRTTESTKRMQKVRKFNRLFSMSSYILIFTNVAVGLLIGLVFKGRYLLWNVYFSVSMWAATSLVGLISGVIWIKNLHRTSPSRK